MVELVYGTLGEGERIVRIWDYRDRPDALQSHYPRLAVYGWPAVIVGTCIDCDQGFLGGSGRNFHLGMEEERWRIRTTTEWVR
jgi:hypothetical protein